MINTDTLTRCRISNFKERSILHDNIIHMERFEAVEILRKRNEMRRVVRLVKLEKVGLAGVIVSTPAEFRESLLKLGVGTDHMVCWEIDKDPWSSPRSCGCAGMGRLFLLERFSCRICYQPSHSVLVKYPHTRHCKLREGGRGLET